MIKIEKYNSSKFKDWNDLVHKSKNGTFLLDRNFMDYHSDRFEDCSLLIYRNKKLEAIFPANIVGETVYSHQGLTYGGIIFTNKISAIDMLEIFDQIKLFYRVHDIKKIIYKPIPYIYYKYPSEEVLFALYRSSAKMVGCNISSTINLKNLIPFNESRKSGYRKGLKNELKISENPSFDAFWFILESNLKSRYGVKPVHSLHEIKLLKFRFPNNIFLHTVEKDNVILAGVVMFVSDKVAHVQYISASEEGKFSGALDLLFHRLINEIYKDCDFFDFGQSTEKNGDYLNDALIFQKEGFGGRGVVYNIYEIEL